MALPNFFIIGAPKCGTTSLYEYLGAHPRIFMCYPKEPCYYCTDLPVIRKIKTRDEYLDLFASAPPDSARGEASPWYLYSKDAVPQILSDNPNAKFLICLRNPVDMFLSYHQERVFRMVEPVTDIRQAWALEASRRAEAAGDLHAEHAFMLMYSEICSLGAQVERLLAVAPRQSLHFVFFEDLASDMKGVYERTLAFLGIESDGRTDFPVFNVRQKPKYPWLTEFIHSPPFPLNYAKAAARGILRKIYGHPPDIYGTLLSEPAQRPSLPPDFRREVTAYFAPDVKRLAELTGRDLTRWLDR